MRNPFFLTVIWIAIPVPPTAASCGGGTSGIIREQKPWSAEHQDKDSHRSSDKDRDKNRDGKCDKSRKGDIRHGSDRPRGCSPRHAETTMMSAAVPTSVDIHAGMTVALTTTKQSNGMGPVPAHHRGRRRAAHS